MRETVLLGAGASIEAGVPGAYEMSRQMVERFHEDPALQRYAPVLSFVASGLMFQQGVRGNNPYDGIDVEELFNAVQLLEGRNSLEAAPFIGSWHPAVAKFDQIKSSPSSTRRSARRLSRDLDRFVESRNPFSMPTLERRLSEIVETQQPKPGEGEIYRKTNDSMIRNLVNFVWIKQLKVDKVRYLSPLLRLLERQENLVVATLNYDNAVELMAGSYGVGTSTGIEAWSNTGTFDFSGEGLKLLKLHGSIDWALGYGQTSPERPMPHQIISHVAKEEIHELGFEPAVVFGQRNKLTAEGPFLDLLRSFRNGLNDADRLTVIGYSFRDSHINEYLSQWLNEDQGRCMRVIDPYFERSREPYAEELRNCGPERVERILKKTSVGLAELFGS